MTVCPTAWAATAHVQYVSSSSVYLDGGSTAGLEEGTTVHVDRNGQRIAELVVEFVAQTSAACKILSATTALLPGDICTFTAAQAPVPPQGTPAGAAGSAAAPKAGKTARGLGAGDVRGMIAMYYRRSVEADGSFSNPALRADLRWDGSERRQLGLRVRADRPAIELGTSPATTATSNALRLYQAEARYRGAQERFDLTGGRYIPERLELMGYVDGGGVGVRPMRALRFGVAGGRGALPGATGFETGGTKLGGYIEASDPALGVPRWHALAGAIRIDDPDITRRQFVMLRGDARLGARVQTFEYAEVDVNPGWKRYLGASHVEFTSWSVGAQIIAHRRVDFTATVDSRRDLLLPEQRSAPPEQRLLQTTRGASGAVHVQPWRWASLRLGGDFRKRTDGTRTTRAVDASFYGSPPSLPALSGGIHANVYDASPGRGQLYDLSLNYRATSWLDVRAAGGTQHANPTSSTTASTDTFWMRGGAGIQAPHGLWLEVSGEWRDATRSREWYLEAGERF